MNRSGLFVLAAGFLASGCGLATLVPGAIDPACHAHPDPVDCQGALVAGMEGIGIDLDGHVVVVAPISCADGECTTWVSAVPATKEDCVPLYEAQVAREPIGPWTVVMSTHGDPPCAFEP